MTYGQLRLRLSKGAPGVDPELIEGWIQDRYTQLLDLIPWKRVETDIVIQCPPSYTVGTVTAVQGNAVITGDGTQAWTSAMNGLMIRVANGQEYYQVLQLTTNTIQLDRPYEGSTLQIVTSAVAVPGTAYVPGDVFNVTGGNGLAQGVILTVDGVGGVTGYSMTNVGNGYAVGVAAITGGHGTGFTVNITSVGGSTGLSYRIDQNIFVMPKEARLVRGVRPLHNALRPLERIMPAELNALAPQRTSYGTPRYYNPTWDTVSDPPQLQLELYDIPSSPDSTGSTLSWVVQLTLDQDDFDPNTTSTSLLPWVRSSALYNGVMADVMMPRPGSPGDLNAAASYEGRFSLLAKEMSQVNAMQRGAMQLQVDREFQTTSTPRHHGRFHRGFTG